MDFDGMKLFLVEFSVEETAYMGDTHMGDREFAIVFARDGRDAEDKVERKYPSEEYSHYRCVHFFKTTEAIM